jgi:protein-S-isoprenylcysteine O-methyltransferase Ste14
MRNFINILPPTYFFIYLVVSVILVLLFPSFKVIYPPYTYLGVPLILSGIWLTLWVDWLLKKEKTTVKPQERPTALITKGIFRISRHPMYLGFVLLLLGLAVFLGNLMVFFAPLAMLITLEKVFVSVEEKKLEEEFEEQYKNYKRRVRKWL